LTKEKNVITNLENIFFTVYYQLFGYTFFKISSFVFSRRKKYRFGTTWG